jgi:hypothetical protein
VTWRSARRDGWGRFTLVFVVMLPVACNERFEFDVPSAAGMTGAAGAGGHGPGEVGGSAGSALAGGGASFAGTASGSAGLGGGAAVGGQAGSVAASERCGELRACPSGLHCVEAECRACATDADCVESGLARCDLTRYRCVACISSTDCGEDYRCDSLANRCLPACDELSDCPQTAHGCNTRRGVCYDCDADRECATSPLGKFCAVDGSGCVQCRNDADCNDALCDPLTGRCVECRDGLDCSSRLCAPLEHVCLVES